MYNYIYICNHMIIIIYYMHIYIIDNDNHENTHDDIDNDNWE